jgi:hypothetical protein
LLADLCEAPFMRSVECVANKSAQPEGCAQEEWLEGLSHRPAAVAITRGCVGSARPTYILYDWYTANSTAIRAATIVSPLTVLKAEAIAVNPAPIT